MSTGTEIVEVRVYVPDWSSITPGERIIGVDGYGTGEPLTVVEVTQDGVLRIETPAGAVARRLYPGSHESVTVIRRQPITMTSREAAALRRNPRYVRLLRTLLDGPRLADDRGDGVCFAAMGEQHGYDWTERAGRGWQITERGRAAVRYAGNQR